LTAIIANEIAFSAQHPYSFPTRRETTTYIRIAASIGYLRVAM